jgi:hypothetical protein
MCTEQHSCYHGEMSTLPTRVIDVGKEQPCLHLSNGAKAPYITLSHCWGELETITTTKSTLEARMSGFSMESLPKLFQDAVKVTRLLNIHYLWIDSLCIIQDSHEEWSSESARMGDIYRCSFLTLYALDAANSHETMLGERASLTPDNARISDTALLRKQYFQKSTLYKRAWALQERLLSPRILYYSNKEMLWECLECTARESTLRITPFHLVPYSRYTYECLDVKKRLLLDPGPQPSLPLLPHKDWHIIVVEYTRCRLTKDTDKLPALSGIAAIFQRNTGFTYLAGLWKEDITSGLLWYVAPTSEDGSNEKQSFSQYIAPSWSWASSNSPVGHPTVTGPEIRGLKFRFSDLELLDFSITRLDANPMGEITQAFITVRAFRKPSYYKKLHAPHEICGIFDEYGKKWGRIVLDAQNYALRRGRNDERIPCMAVWVCHGELKSFDVDRPVTELLYFLVVIEDPDQEWAWRRVGLGQTYDGDAAFRGCQKVEMKLV